ncbi:hypothetical protein NE664_03950 [Anaerotignum faecicola]|nr:hypothetical protein [Anaerotignum faecicola]
MLVYFQNNPDFSGSEKKKVINMPFYYGNFEFKLLDCYEFPKGVVLDIICLLDYDILKDYHLKYNVREEELTSSEINEAMMNKATPDFTAVELYADENLVSKEITNEGGVYIAGYSKYTENSIPVKLVEEYDFLKGDNKAFYFARLHAAYCGTRRFSLDTANTVCFKVIENTPFYWINYRFSVSLSHTEKNTFTITHPENKGKYNVKLEEAVKYLFDIILLAFSTDPPLPERQRLVIENTETINMYNFAIENFSPNFSYIAVKNSDTANLNLKGIECTGKKYKLVKVV